MVLKKTRNHIGKPKIKHHAHTVSNHRQIQKTKWILNLLARMDLPNQITKPVQLIFQDTRGSILILA